MDEEPSISGGITRSIPQELQDDIDIIAAKSLPKEAIPAALDDNQKRWLVVGICLHSVVSPALRKYVESILTVLYNDLNRYHKIDTQIYPTYLKKDPKTGALLNYEVVNNNNAMHVKKIAKYNFTIKNAVDLSKLFLQTHMAHYTGFDETCDSSALLGLIINIGKFDPVIKSDAYDVRTKLRNSWAHCDFTEWDAVKYSNSFQLMKKLVKDLKLSINEEKFIIEEMEKWEINGQRLTSGTTHGLELVNEFRQQTHCLATYVSLLASETDDNLVRIKKELAKFEIIFNKIAQLDEDLKKGFSRIDEKLLTQDKTLKNYSTQIVELKEDVSKCACYDYHKVVLERWQKQEDMFVETPVVKIVSQILDSKQSILLVGEPGIGKSMLLHHIALQNKSEYSIIPCSEIQDIRYHFKTDIRQMFVLDDIYGRFTVSESDVEHLLKNEDSIKLMFEKGNCKIAATCRLDIFNDEKIHASCSLFKSRIFNLSAEYSKNDKLRIGTKYLTEGNIQLLRDQDEPFTPLMCYLYSKNEDFNLTDFLHGPYETYRKEWDSFDRCKYCALFLCVIFNGVIEESLFDIFNKDINIEKKVLKNIFEICEINRGTSSSTMKKTFDSIIGTYLRKTEKKYIVIHDQMFDFICCYFGKKDTLVRGILNYAHIEVLNERTQLESINEQHDKFAIIVPKEYEQCYFDRIKKELLLGKLNQCFCNAQMKFKKYRALLLKLLISIDNDNRFDNDTIKQNIITSCFRGYYDLAKYLISKDICLDKGYSHNSPLTGACKGQHMDILQLLINKGCGVNQVNSIGETLLTAACRRGNEKIVQFLIDKGVDLNQVKRMGETPLTAACSGGNEKIVQLLINKGGDVNQIDGIGETAITAVCHSGNETIVELLLDNGCNVNQVNDTKETPLTAACRSGNEKTVQLLLEKEGDVNLVENMLETPLTVACSRGNMKIVQLLIDKGGDVNQMDGMRSTPLTAACSRENRKIVRVLLDNGGDANQVNGMGETPLTAACRSGNKKIVLMLLNKAGSVNQVNGMRQSPLTVACNRGHEEIVQLLIDKGCDVNQVDGMRKTPLTAAFNRENRNLVRLPIDKGFYVKVVSFSISK